MPPVFFAFAAAAGFFAAARAIAALIGNTPPDQMAHGETRAETAASDTARNLGQLERDPTTGVYRPKT